MYIFTLAAGMILVGLGLFLFIVAGTKDIEINLELINERGALAENLPWTFRMITEFIQHHSEMKQLSADPCVISNLRLMFISFHNYNPTT